jgi:hypothetical protein
MTAYRQEASALARPQVLEYIARACPTDQYDEVMNLCSQRNSVKLATLCHEPTASFVIDVETHGTVYGIPGTDDVYLLCRSDYDGAEEVPSGCAVKSLDYMLHRLIESHR